MAIRDFYVFGECVKVYAKMSEWTALTLPVIDSIQSNCLPLHADSSHNVYPPETLLLLSHRFEPPVSVAVSEVTSRAMQSLLDRILQLRFCNRKAKICECF